jgi:hypothetical protein
MPVGLSPLSGSISYNEKESAMNEHERARRRDDIMRAFEDGSVFDADDRTLLTDLLQFRGRFDPFYSVGVRENRKM